MSSPWPDWFAFDEDGTIAKRTLVYWEMTEDEFALALTGVIVLLLLLCSCIALLCWIVCCRRRAPDQKYVDEPPPPEPVPEPTPLPTRVVKPQPVPEPISPQPKPAKPLPPRREPSYDGGDDKLIAINGRPVSESGRGVPLPYGPADITIVITPNAPPVGAVLLPVHTADDGVDRGRSGLDSASGFDFDEESMGMRAAMVSGELERAAHDGSSWEAEKIFGLEERVRMLEAQLAAAQSGGALTGGGASPGSLPGVPRVLDTPAPRMQHGRSNGAAASAEAPRFTVTNIS
mmetsp:Transcript_23112/g.59389  ORF Transcript_23112/g.59389 Transcript_23112/m.59389 type:complete len:289 (-) Transcript_23112:211-1077(-)